MAKRRANGEGSIYHRKDGRWEASAFVPVINGGRKRIRFVAKSREQVAAKLQEALRQARRNIPRSDRHFTVGDWLDLWLREIMPQRVRSSTLNNYRDIIELHLKPRLGRKKLETLSVLTVQSAIDQMMRDGIGTRTIGKSRQVLSSALTHAMRRELVFRNVAMAVEVPSYRRAPIQPWTAGQAKHFLESSRKARLHAAYVLLLVYGMREGEVLGLRWRDIDFDNGEIHVRQQVHHRNRQFEASEVKTESGRRVLPMIDVVRTVLTDYAAVREVEIPEFVPGSPPHSTDDTVVQTQSGTPVEASNLRRSWYRDIERAGLPAIKIHHARHTAATLLASMGVPERETQLILGHSNIATTQQIYTHANLHIRRAALERIGDLIGTQKPDIEVLGSGYRQNYPQDRATPQEAEVVKDAKDPRITGVRSEIKPGSTDRDRTCDLRLMSLTKDTFDCVATPVITSLHSATRRQFLAAVAVKKTHIFDEPAVSDRIAHHGQILADISRHRQAEKLKHLSFPYNLITHQEELL